MSKSRPITGKELDAIKQSVAAARKRFEIEHTSYRFGDHLKPSKSQHNWRFPFDNPLMKALEAVSADATNTKFREAFHKLLTVESTFARRQRILNRLEAFLLDHWAESKDGLPELFYLKPAALLFLCQKGLGFNQLTEDALIKTRQRLGLKPFKRQKRDAVFRDGRWTFPQVDNR
jgi:hypothetical protein